MLNQIDIDADAGRFSAWGLSTVMDRGAGGPVLARNQFDGLHFAAGLEAHWPVGNAGLLHVYGYLISVVQTPYGPKRDRWLDGTLAAAFGRPADYFSLRRAEDENETVLQRVTDALIPHLEDPHADNFDLLTFDDGVPESAVLFRTTVVQHDPDEPAAVVYGLHDGERMRAITAFPLADSSRLSLGTLVDEPPRMRYNAALPPLPPRSPLERRAVAYLSV